MATNISWSLQKCGCKIIYCFTQFHEIELDETNAPQINSALWSEQESIEEEIMGVLTDDK